MAKLGAVQSPGYPFHPANPAENDLPPRRKLILDTIREADAPLQPREIANELHLHLNTIRDHLAALVEAGLLIRKTVPHAGRGRPAIAYMTPPGDADTPDRRTSNALIVMLLDHLDETSPHPRSGGPPNGRGDGTLLGNHPQLGTPALPRAPAARSRLGLRRGLAQFHQHPDAGQLPTGTGGENPL